MNFTVSELQLLRWLIKVAQQAVPSNHPAAEHIPTMLDRIDLTSGNRCQLGTGFPAEDSKRRHEGHCSPERTNRKAELRQLKQERITTREAASRLGIGQRAIQQRILRGTLKAERVGRIYLINPENLL